VVPRGCREGEMGSNCYMYGGFFLGDEKVLELDSSNS